MKKISLKGLNQILSEKKLKNVMGGSYPYGADVTGVRCYSGQCYCDTYYYDGDYFRCDTPCGMENCNDYGISC